MKKPLVEGMTRKRRDQCQAAWRVQVRVGRHREKKNKCNTEVRRETGQEDEGNCEGMFI